MTSPNHPAAGKAGIARPLAIGHHWPGLPEPGRSIMNTFLPILLVFVVNPAWAAESFKSIYLEAARSELAAITTNRPDAKVLNSITNLPPAIRERFAGTADAGEPFSSGCVREYAGHRFLTASRVDNIYVVAVEHGGIVYNWSIFGFVVNDAGMVIQEIEPSGAANRDQPLSPGTNRSPPAAGPGR